jgi:tetratricopeptide (TPR) repeat protein
MRLSPSQIETELRLAREAHLFGDASEADRRIASVLLSSPDHVGALLGKGMILVSRVGSQAEALQCFTQALRVVPTNVEALAWACLTCLNLGKGEQAERFALRLNAVQPKSDRACFLLSNSLTLQGRLEEALENVERALAILPLEPDYVIAKAQLLRRLNWSTQAIAWYRRALKLRPTAELAVELSELLVQEGEVSEALIFLEQAATNLPPEERPHALLAQAYTESQNFESAAENWALAKSLTNDQPRLVLARVKSEIYAGRIEIAEQLIREVLERDPMAAQFYQPLTAIGKITSADVLLIENMERLLAESTLDAAQEADVRYALGKAYNDLGEYQEAMRSYDEANRIAYDLSLMCQRFAPAAWRAYTDLQIEFFTKERIKSLAQGGLESETPLFILGMIRSGTTLTEQILSRHPKVADGGEKSFWPDHRGDVLDERTRTFDAIAGRRLGERYLRLLTSTASSARYVTEKNPSNIFISALIHCIFPKAKLIHVVRQPVDNLLSIWMTPIQTGLPFVYNRDNLVFVYREYLRLSNHLRQVLPADQFCTLEYERLTSCPVTAIEELLSFLDLEPESDCFHPERNARTVRTPSYYQARQPINTDSQERWRLYEHWLGPFAELLS